MGRWGEYCFKSVKYKWLSISKTIKYYPLDQSVTWLSLLYDISLAMSMKEDPFLHWPNNIQNRPIPRP